MGFPTGRRLFVLAAAVVVLVVVTAATVYRVLAPAEVSTPAAGTYPTAPAWDPAPGVIARLPAAPLVVDGRIRVYAAQRQVYADLPVTPTPEHPVLVLPPLACRAGRRRGQRSHRRDPLVRRPDSDAGRAYRAGDLAS